MGRVLLGLVFAAFIAWNTIPPQFGYRPPHWVHNESTRTWVFVSSTRGSVANQAHVESVLLLVLAAVTLVTALWWLALLILRVKSDRARAAARLATYRQRIAASPTPASLERDLGGDAAAAQPVPWRDGHRAILLTGWAMAVGGLITTIFAFVQYNAFGPAIPGLWFDTGIRSVGVAAAILGLLGVVLVVMVRADRRRDLAAASMRRVAHTLSPEEAWRALRRPANAEVSLPGTQGQLAPEAARQPIGRPARSGVGERRNVPATRSGHAQPLTPASPGLSAGLVSMARGYRVGAFVVLPIALGLGVAAGKIYEASCVPNGWYTCAYRDPTVLRLSYIAGAVFFAAFVTGVYLWVRANALGIEAEAEEAVVARVETTAEGRAQFPVFEGLGHQREASAIDNAWASLDRPRGSGAREGT